MTPKKTVTLDYGEVAHLKEQYDMYCGDIHADDPTNPLNKERFSNPYAAKAYLKYLQRQSGVTITYSKTVIGFDGTNPHWLVYFRGTIEEEKSQWYKWQQEQEKRADKVGDTKEDTRCGNDAHPNGAWHLASPLPLSWDWAERLKQWRRIRKYGCGCK